MKILILPAILFIIATALICYDYNVNGYNGALTVIGGIVGVLFAISLLIATAVLVVFKKDEQK